MFERGHARALDPGPGLHRTPDRSAPTETVSALGSGRKLRPSEVPIQARAYGQDFGHVRIHDDERAHMAANALEATAFSFGHHVVLSAAPRHDTLAHELAHVVQQRGAAAGTLELEPAAGALERDAERSAASGRPPALRASAVKVQRQEQPQPPPQQSFMYQRLPPRERAALDAFLAKHRFYVEPFKLPHFDDTAMSSADIALRAHADESLKQSRVDLIKKDIDDRQQAANIWGAAPPAPQRQQTTAEKVLEKLTAKPSTDPGPQIPQADRPLRDDPAGSSSMTMHGMAQKINKNAPDLPTQTPAIPIPGPDSSSVRYLGAGDRYAPGTAISFTVLAPDAFWKRPGDKAVMLVSEKGNTVATAPIRHDGKVDSTRVTWAVPYTEGKYTIIVTVGGVPDARSGRALQVVKAQ